jgi:plastocyanin
MRRYLLLPTGLTALALAVTGFFFLSPQPAPAADSVKTIEIVKNADGKFVFSDANAKVEPGQTVKWVAKDADVPHQLVPDTEDDALADTGAFDSTSAPSQTFKSAGTIKYHCAIHPKSMKGTITVSAAAEAPAKAPEKAPAKAKPQPSYDPY